MNQRLALSFLWCFCFHSWTMTDNGYQNIFVHGKPYIILTSTRSKCYSVIAPRSQIITIEYEAPDLVIPEEGLQAATRRAEENSMKEKEKSENAETKEGDGLDTKWNERMKDRLERIKSKKLRDTSITVMQKTAGISPRKSDSKQNTKFDEDGTIVTTGTEKIREELSQRRGRIEFLTGHDSGNIEVCVQSILANFNKPVRFHLRADMDALEGDDDDDDDVDDDSILESIHENKKAKQKENDPDHLEHKEISSKVSRLERDLQTLQNRAKACLNNADYNKEQEALFYEKSISMNRASKYWPIIQLTVLLVTGFTQANHIVRYLKTHRIGI